MRGPPHSAERGPRKGLVRDPALDQDRRNAREDTRAPAAVQPSLPWDAGDPRRVEQVDLGPTGAMALERPRIGHAGQDPPRHRSRDRETSVEAAQQLDPERVRTQLAHVLEVLREAGCAGATRDEIAAELDWRGDKASLSRRITDLCQADLALDIGPTRPGDSGRQLTVWGARGACGGRAA
jgi:hypothetical protein